MQIIYGEMFDKYQYQNTDVFLVTGNSYINSFGELVMGRGAALQLKQLAPALPKIFGSLIEQYYGHLQEYNLIIIKLLHDVGVFQVKTHFKSKADLRLIERSVFKLHQYARLFPWRHIVMNYPGIGNGGRTREEVEPLIKTLPDNVHIYLQQ